MNDKRKPSFQSAGKTFQERSVGEKYLEKPSQNRPHFNDKFNGNRNEKSRFSRDKQEVKETKITQLSLSRAPSNKNVEKPKVQVTIKTTGTIYKTKEKKNGCTFSSCA
ncbi:rRNA methylase [Haemophilus influenzae PittEE]|nr:rRNA methylase [Haemophilus influenzae PittEE]